MGCLFIVVLFFVFFIFVRFFVCLGSLFVWFWFWFSILFSLCNSSSGTHSVDQALVKLIGIFPSLPLQCWD